MLCKLRHNRIWLQLYGEILGTPELLMSALGKEIAHPFWCISVDLVVWLQIRLIFQALWLYNVSAFLLGSKWIWLLGIQLSCTTSLMLTGVPLHGDAFHSNGMTWDTNQLLLPFRKTPTSCCFFLHFSFQPHLLSTSESQSTCVHWQRGA